MEYYSTSLIPGTGDYSYHGHQWWGTTPATKANTLYLKTTIKGTLFFSPTPKKEPLLSPTINTTTTITNIIDGALCFPLKPTMGHDFYHWMGTIPLTVTNDGEPTMGYYSFHWNQQWGTNSFTDTSNGALFFPLRPTMGHYCSHGHPWDQSTLGIIYSHCCLDIVYFNQPQCGLFEVWKTVNWSIV